MRSLTFCASLLICAGLQAQTIVVNGASFRTDQPVSAGSWATVTGAFAGVSVTQATTLPLPKTLGGVTVTLNGTEVPLYYVSATQINFLIPSQSAPGFQPVQVKTASATVAGNVRVISTGPGIFVKDATLRPPRGAAINQDGTENASGNPARRGQVVSIYATGPGALSQAIADGVAAPRTPLVTTISTPQVYIGGVAAEVQFSGMAPELVGVWQVNAFVPDRAFITGRVPVQVFMDGIDSNEVSIFVQ
jgi:uncharacterized protein (TIGR03437 family)